MTLRERIALYYTTKGGLCGAEVAIEHERNEATFYFFVPGTMHIVLTASIDCSPYGDLLCFIGDEQVSAEAATVLTHDTWTRFDKELTAALAGALEDYKRNQ